MKYKNPVNDRYFDRESPSMAYVLGSFYSCGILTRNNIIFRSSDRDIVELVKEELESKHMITHTKGKKSYHMEIRSDHLNSRLLELGLVPKRERTYPDLKDGSHRHFIRGFMDSRAYFIEDDLTKISIDFNEKFLGGLNDVLAEYAGVQRIPRDEDRITYGQKDSMRIYKFIYSARGLYLLSKKAGFKTEVVLKDPAAEKKRVAQMKIERAKELLAEGVPTPEIIGVIGFKHLEGFYTAFKDKTGMTVRQFRESLRE